MKRFIFVRYPQDMEAKGKEILAKLNEHLAGNKETTALMVPEEIVITEYLSRTRDEILEELVLIGQSFDGEDDEGDFVDEDHLTGRQVN